MNEFKNKIEFEENEIFQRKLLEFNLLQKNKQESLGSLNERLAKHKMWLESDGKNGIRFEARNENFSGMDFSHADLRKSIFVSCVLDYCNFFDCNLGKSASFVKCSIKKARLVYSELEGTIFMDCIIEDSSFRYSKFIRTSVANAPVYSPDISLTNNDFRDCVFKDTIFSSFNFCGSIIDGSTFEGVRFTVCNLSYLDFTKTEISSSLVMYQCKCNYIKLSGISIERSSLKNCDLTNAEFENSYAQGTEFSKSNLTRASFRNAKITQSIFNETTGSDMIFFGADISNSELHFSSFRFANFYNCDLNKSDLSGSDLVGALINDTTNTNLTNFSGCLWVNGKRCKAESVGVCYQED